MIFMIESEGQFAVIIVIKELMQKPSEQMIKYLKDSGEDHNL